jgi:hypothetical protein
MTHLAIFIKTIATPKMKNNEECGSLSILAIEKRHFVPKKGEVFFYFPPIALKSVVFDLENGK